jgi:CheY-like chemotaxis protein
MAIKILLADDSLTIQKVVELTFSDAETRLMAVGSGDRAVQALDEFLPDIVLADVVMPGLTGYDVCDAVKQRPGGAFVPVVLLTGTFEPFDRARAERVGSDAIVTKPFDSHALQGLVRDLVGKARAAREDAAAAEPIAPPPAIEAPPTTILTAADLAEAFPAPAPAPDTSSTLVLTPIDLAEMAPPPFVEAATASPDSESIYSTMAMRVPTMGELESAAPEPPPPPPPPVYEQAPAFDMEPPPPPPPPAFFEPEPAAVAPPPPAWEPKPAFEMESPAPPPAPPAFSEPEAAVEPPPPPPPPPVYEQAPAFDMEPPPPPPPPAFFEPEPVGMSVPPPPPAPSEEAFDMEPTPPPLSEAESAFETESPAPPPAFEPEPAYEPPPPPPPAVYEPGPAFAAEPPPPPPPPSFFESEPAFVPPPPPPPPAFFASAGPDTEPVGPVESPFGDAPEPDAGFERQEIELEAEAAPLETLAVPAVEDSLHEPRSEEVAEVEKAPLAAEESVEPFPEMDAPVPGEDEAAPWDEGPVSEIPPPPPEMSGIPSEADEAEPITRDLDADLAAFESSGRNRRRPEIWERHAALIGEEVPDDIDVHGTAPAKAAAPAPVSESSELEEIAAAARLEDFSRLIPAAPPVVAVPLPLPSPADEAVTTTPLRPLGSALTDADVDRIARRVVELLSDRVVRDIAWEVVPEYAERLVRERIAEVERAG